MKTNCKISKIIASILVMATILCFGATGFAASYSTVTTYNLDAEGTVDVTSTVTDLGSTEQVTYLATNGAGDILYVDQDSADEISTGVYGKVFTYSTTTAKIGSGTTAVKFGATTTTPITPILTSDGMLSSVDVAVTAGDSTLTVNTTDVSSGFTMGLGQTVTVNIAPKTGYEILTITANGASVDKTVSSFSLTGIENPSIVVTTQEVDVAPDLTGTTLVTDNLVANKEVTLFSQISVEPSKMNDDVLEYGIVVLMSAHYTTEQLTKELLIANGTEYRAYGFGSNNAYQVTLVSNGAKTSGKKDVFAPGQTYVMAPYLKVAGEGTFYGEMQSFTLQ